MFYLHVRLMLYADLVLACFVKQWYNVNNYMMPKERLWENRNTGWKVSSVREVR